MYRFNVFSSENSERIREGPGLKIKGHCLPMFPDRKTLSLGARRAQRRKSPQAFRVSYLVALLFLHQKFVPFAHLHPLCPPAFSTSGNRQSVLYIYELFSWFVFF